MIRAAWRRAAAALVPLVLAACATPPPAVDGTPWISGRMAVRVDASPGQPASTVSANFDLRGNGEQGELRLSTPIGTSIAQARWAPSGVVLASGRSETRYPDLDALSRDALGEVLPLRAFPDWLAGRPWGGAPSTARPDGFEQLGWHVSLARLADGAIDASRAAPPAVVVRVRLERPA